HHCSTNSHDSYRLPSISILGRFLLNRSEPSIHKSRSLYNPFLSFSDISCQPSPIVPALPCFVLVTCSLSRLRNSMLKAARGLSKCPERLWELERLTKTTVVTLHPLLFGNETGNGVIHTGRANTATFF